MLADENVLLTANNRSMLENAVRMLQESKGSTELLDMLEEKAYALEVGRGTERTTTPAFTPLPQKRIKGRYFATRFTTEVVPERTTLAAKTMPELDAAIKDQMRLDKSVLAEGKQKELFPEARAEVVTERATPANFQKMLDSKNIQGMRDALAQAKEDNKAVLEQVKKYVPNVHKELRAATEALNKAKAKAETLAESAAEQQIGRAHV